MAFFYPEQLEYYPNGFYNPCVSVFHLDEKLANFYSLMRRDMSEFQQREQMFLRHELEKEWAKRDKEIVVLKNTVDMHHQHVERRIEDQLKLLADMNRSSMDRIQQCVQESIKTFTEDFCAKMEVLSNRLELQEKTFAVQIEDLEKMNGKLIQDLQIYNDEMKIMSNQLEELKAENGQLKEEMKIMSNQQTNFEEDAKRQMEDLKASDDKLKEELDNLQKEDDDSTTSTTTAENDDDEASTSEEDIRKPQDETRILPPPNYQRMPFLVKYHTIGREYDEYESDGGVCSGDEEERYYCPLHDPRNASNKSLQEPSGREELETLRDQFCDFRQDTTERIDHLTSFVERELTVRIEEQMDQMKDGVKMLVEKLELALSCVS